MTRCRAAVPTAASDEAALRRTYPTVLAASIRVESGRLGDGQIRQTSPFLRIEIAAPHPVADDLAAAGIACSVREDELSLLWDKLAFLARVAVVTTALDTTLGEARQDPRFRGCRREALAVAEAPDTQALTRLIENRLGDTTKPPQ